MKALLVLAAVVVVAAVVGDVAAKQVAEDRVAAQIEGSIKGASEVEAEITSFPFLPALLAGELDEMQVDIGRVRSDGLTVSDLRVELEDLTFDAVDLFAGDGAIRVGRGEGHVFGSERAVSRALRRSGVDATVAFEGSGASLSAAGRTVRVDAVEVRDGALVFELPAGPVTLQMPRTFEGLRYDSARVEEGRLRIEIVLSGRRFEL